MGLDASVRCCCWEDGETTPPPRPELVRVDEEGYLRLDLPRAGHRADHEAFDDWLRTCCPHADSRYADEIIANWTGYRLFQQKLGEAGWEYFPVLQSELPNVNGGLTDAAASAAALMELDYFESFASLGQTLVLADVATGQAVHERVDAYGGVFILGGGTGVDVGIDADGLFVTDRSDGRELFRSMDFDQRPLGAEGAEFTDLATGRLFACPVRVTTTRPWPDGRWQDDQGRWRSEVPGRLRVEHRAVTADDFAYILRPLRVVFEASVATGNPVRWC